MTPLPALLLTCLVLTAVGTKGHDWFKRHNSVYDQQIEKNSSEEKYKVLRYEKGSNFGHCFVRMDASCAYQTDLYGVLRYLEGVYLVTRTRMTVTMPSCEHSDDEYWNSFGISRENFGNLRDDMKVPEHVDIRDAYEEVVVNSYCMRMVDTFVNTTEDNEYKYEPTRIRVQKCDGMCQLRKTCVSTGTKIMKIPVKRIHLATNAMDHAYAVVNVDKGCMCECAIKRAECREKQMYDMKSCQCVCADMIRKQNDCFKTKLKKWVSESCECECRNKGVPCSINYYWNNDNCNCTRRKRSKKPSTGR